jgi:hypothetical protein
MLFFLKNLFLTLAHQNDQKTLKKFILNKNKIKIKKKNNLHRRIPKHADCPLK